GALGARRALPGHRLPAPDPRGPDRAQGRGRVKDRLTTLGFTAGWRLVRALPLPVARALFTGAADRAWKKNGPGTQRLRRNYQQVVGTDVPETLVRDGLRSYARYWMEAFRLPSRTLEQNAAGFHMEAGSYDQMKSAIAEG